jgi:hypothetical protein
MKKHIKQAFSVFLLIIIISAFISLTKASSEPPCPPNTDSCTWHYNEVTNCCVGYPNHIWVPACETYCW